MTVDDVIWTFNRLKASPDFKGIFAPFKEMKKADDGNAVDIVTDGPFPLVLHNATYIFPLDSKFYDRQGQIGEETRAEIKSNTAIASPRPIFLARGRLPSASREQGVKVDVQA